MISDGSPGAGCLAAYRLEVDEAVRRAVPAADGADPALHTILERLGERPGVRVVLDALPGTPESVLGGIGRELAAYRPHRRSNASGPASLLRILLLQQIDVMWWAGEDAFADARSVRSSPRLTSLSVLRREDLLRFRFRVAPRGLPGRARNYAVRRYAPGREPHSSGLSHDAARPAMVGLLNDVATRFAAAAPWWTGGLWVNCIVRSTVDQWRLRELGYSALLPSSHCAGFAADLEMTWLHAHGVAGALQGVLLHLRDEGILNVIDEGQAWHVCLNPTAVARYEQPAARRTHVVGAIG